LVRLPAPLRPLFPYLKPVYHRGTGLIAPTMQALSRAFGRHLPTGVVLTLSQAAVSSGGRCLVARPAETVSRPRPIGIPVDHPAFASVRAEVIPAVSVAELPGGRVLHKHSAVVSAKGDLVQEVSWYFDTTTPRQHPLFLNPNPGPPFEVDGRLGVLASRGDHNYYHFLVDVLPRIAVLESRPEIAPVDRWYVPEEFAFQRELLDLFGVPVEQRLDSSAHPHVRAEMLVVPGLPAMEVVVPPWVIALLRERLLPAGAGQGERRRIYLSRGSAANNRRVINEDQVISLLADRGFEVLDPGALSVAEQIEVFSNASMIVSAHGAGLTNLMFAPAGSTVVEMFPGGKMLPDCYWRMTHAVPGAEYRYLVSERGFGGNNIQGVLVADLDVDVRALARIIDV
jgi:capsular polysaccharide biosynthesis protein